MFACEYLHNLNNVAGNEQVFTYFMDEEYGWKNFE